MLSAIKKTNVGLPTEILDFAYCAQFIDLFFYPGGGGWLSQKIPRPRLQIDLFPNFQATKIEEILTGVNYNVNNAVELLLGGKLYILPGIFFSLACVGIFAI